MASYGWIAAVVSATGVGGLLIGMPVPLLAGGGVLLGMSLFRWQRRRNIRLV